MTRSAQEQQQAQALAERLVAKLRSFRDSLPAEEQLVLDLTLRRPLAEEVADDVSGYSPNRAVVWAAAKAIAYYITHATPIWSDDHPGFPSSGAVTSSTPGFEGGSNGTHRQ